MIICESSRKLDKGWIYKTGQKAIEVKNKVVYDLYDTNTKNYDTYTEDEIKDFLKNHNVFGLYLTDDLVKTKYLARTYSNEDKENKRLFLYVYENYAIIGIPKENFVMSSNSGNCKAIFIHEDEIIGEIENFCSSANSFNGSFDLENVIEEEGITKFFMESHSERSSEYLTVHIKDKQIILYQRS